MTQMITVIIAIALAGAISVVSITYGSGAIIAFQANMEASRIISDAQTIATAWRSFARANNGDPGFSASTAYCWGNATQSTGAADLVPNHLPNLPAPPAGAADSTFNYYFPNLFKSFNITGATTKLGPKYAPSDSIALWLKSPKVCQEIVRQAGQSAAVIGSSLQTTAGGSDVNLSTLASPRAVVSPFDCIYKDSDSSGGPSQADVMLFVYRVFDQNLYTASARTACP